MTIDCTNIVKYAKICDKLKDDSQPIYDSGLLDFEHKCMTFGSQKGFGRISMSVEGWDGEKKPFFVNLNSLLNIAREFPVLELNDFTFKHGADSTFEIAHTEDEARFPDFITDGESVAVNIDAECLTAIGRCGAFTDVDGIASINGVFIKDGSVWGTNRTRLCEAHVDVLSGVDIALPRVVWEVMAMDVLGAHITVKKSGSSIFVSNDDAVQLQFVESTVLASPDIHDKVFVSKFDHENSIVLDKNTLANVVNFMQPFVVSSSAQRIALIVSGDTLEVKSQDNNNVISRKIPILEKTGNIENESKIWVGANWLRTMLGVIDADKVRIQLDISKPAINVSAAEDKNALHIVYCRLAEIPQA